MEKDIIIRSAEICDLDQAADIGTRGYQIAYKGIIDDKILNNITVEKTYQKMKISFESEQIVVAELNGEIVGFCRYTLNYAKSDPNAQGEIIAIYIKPELKYNGIGTLVFKYVMDDFRKHKNRRIVLGCLKDNHPSRKFYEKLGGKIYTESCYKKGGKEYREVFYEYMI